MIGVGAAIRVHAVAVHSWDGDTTIHFVHADSPADAIKQSLLHIYPDDMDTVNAVSDAIAALTYTECQDYFASCDTGIAAAAWPEKRAQHDD